jgi:hypothetical protein
MVTLRWYVLSCLPQLTRRVYDDLVVAGEDVLLPLEVVGRRLSPLFPGYLLCRPRTLSVLWSARGAEPVCSSPGRPSPVLDHVVDWLRSQLDRYGVLRAAPAVGLRPGDEVTVGLADGCSVDGVILLLTPGDRVRVLLSGCFGGHSVQAVVPESRVRKKGAAEVRAAA